MNRTQSTKRLSAEQPAHRWQTNSNMAAVADRTTGDWPDSYSAGRETGRRISFASSGPLPSRERRPHYDTVPDIDDRPLHETQYELEYPHLRYWVAAVIIFGFINGFTTAIAFRIGVRNPNFIMGGLAAHGFGLLAYGLVNTAILAVCFWIAHYWYSARYTWLIPLGLSIFGALLSIGNIIAFAPAL